MLVKKQNKAGMGCFAKKKISDTSMTAQMTNWKQSKQNSIAVDSKAYSMLAANVTSTLSSYRIAMFS